MAGNNMVVRNNIAALNVHRNMKNVGSMQMKASERLSSGYKINRASDDAAGLAISEKMRGQIRGLNMSSKNVDDAISLVKTAEGGMQGIDDMLHRIRELLDFASNDTNEHNALGTGDRQKVQDEIDQLVEEIDSMSGRVEYNKKKLIDGSFQDTAEQRTNAQATVDAIQQEYTTAGSKADALVGIMDNAKTDLDAAQKDLDIQIKGNPDAAVVQDLEATLRAAQIAAAGPEGAAAATAAQLKIANNDLKTAQEALVTAQDLVLSTQETVNEGNSARNIASANLTSAMEAFNTKYAAYMGAAGLAGNANAVGFDTTNAAALNTSINANLATNLELIRDAALLPANGVTQAEWDADITKVIDAYKALDAATLAAGVDETGLFVTSNSATNVVSAIGTDIMTDLLSLTSTADSYTTLSKGGAAGTATVASNNAAGIGLVVAAAAPAGSTGIANMIAAQDAKDAITTNTLDFTSGTDYSGANLTGGGSNYQDVIDAAQAVVDNKRLADDVAQAALAPKAQAVADAQAALDKASSGEYNGAKKVFAGIEAEVAQMESAYSKAKTDLESAMTAMGLKKETISGWTAAQLDMGAGGEGKEAALKTALINYDKAAVELGLDELNISSAVSNTALKDFMGTAITAKYDVGGDLPGTPNVSESNVALSRATAVDLTKDGGVDQLHGGLQKLKDGAAVMAVAEEKYQSALAAKNTAQENYDLIAKDSDVASREFANVSTRLSAANVSLDAAVKADDAKIGKPLHFQVGANGGQSLFMSIGSLKSDTLGIGDGKGNTTIDVLKATGADITATIDVIDQAMSYVTTERSKLGAAVNRMEYTQQSLDITSENLSDAESRIRDADMAAEMMNKTKADTLNQVAVAMMSQANQQPQSILQLLG